MVMINSTALSNLEERIWTNDNNLHIHFVGIGGVGNSAIAKVFLELGYKISGSENGKWRLATKLEERGAKVYIGFKRDNINGADLIITSSAYGEDHLELQEAHNLGIPILKRSQMLGILMNKKQGIAISGTHGKTTTSSMISLILERAGLDPTILIGGELIDLDTNAKLGYSSYLVAEADEFDSSFLTLAPYIGVVTNIEPEHLDYYRDLEAIKEAFHKFLSQVRHNGSIVACMDDPQVREVIADLDRHTITYGLNSDSQWRAEDISLDSFGKTHFTALNYDKNIGEFTLRLPGMHNVSNALAAIAVASVLGVDMDSVRGTLACFHGARRRFEHIGTVRGIIVIDDYAHHPTEIRVTLEAARQRFPDKKICCVFQPHTYSRTKFFLSDFAQAFYSADKVIIADIYASAREKDDLGISSKNILELMSHPDANYIGKSTDIADHLCDNLEAGNVLITMGAGDIWKVGTQILEKLHPEDTAPPIRRTYPIEITAV